jgi:hypothetical protein
MYQKISDPLSILLNLSCEIFRWWSFFCLDAKEPKSQGWKFNPCNLGHCQRAHDPSRSARFEVPKTGNCLKNLASLEDRSFAIPQAILQGIVFQAEFCHVLKG